MRTSSSCIWRRSARSSAPSGSSSSSTFGSTAMARASATRCRWPPESWCTPRSPKPSSPTSCSISSARRWRSAFGTLRMARPKPTLARTLICGKQGIVLEHRRRRPPGRRQVRHVARRRSARARASARRSRRSSTGSSSCRCRTGPAGRRIRRPRCPGRAARRRRSLGIALGDAARAGPIGSAMAPPPRQQQLATRHDQPDRDREHAACRPR